MASDLEYISVMEYIQCKQGAQARLEAVELCIDNAILLLASTTEGMGGNVLEFQLDDSMVKQKVVYRSIKEVTESITALQKMANIYRNQLRGRQFILKDIRTFR
jgi:conjugal transfer/entry exclusion protein